MNKKQFWSEALVAGTIMGLVSVAFALAQQATAGVGEEPTFWAKLLSYGSVVVNVLLAFGFTRKYSHLVPVEVGFSVGRALKFVLASMLFVGVIQGVYSAVMANFFIKEELLAMVDEAMVQMQDMLPADQFEATYQSARSAATSPLILTVSSILSNLFTGLLIGIPVGLLVRRQPDIFANPEA